MTHSNNVQFFKDNIFGHPAGLFVLFFTEMWERFSYYGMRALLVLFLTSSLLDGGWAWSREEALSLYGTYTMLVYFTPVIGGYLADKFLGYRWAVVLGALVMTGGHAAMTFNTPTSLYIGITGLIIGNGLFKPNMTSIISEMYTNDPDKKDGAYTIYYMGVNAGAFLGILLCGYIGETYGFHWGFGLAGIFMLLGMLQFWFAQNIFGNIGLSKKRQSKITTKEIVNPKTEVPSNIQRDRYIVVGILAFFTVFFWAAFEQAGGSMTIFANDYTNRVLEGTSATIFRISNTLITVVPLAIITYVLFLLFQITFKKYAISNIFLGASFVIIWGIVIWMLKNQFNESSTEIPASWFGILNSFYIIAFAPLFSKIWESKYNPSASAKFGLGLILLGLGFGFLAYGSASIPSGAQTASVSIVWLILAYLLHTLGELTLSPVGLSYLSKLVPARKIGLMFGLWYVSMGMGNKVAGSMGGMIDQITKEYSLTTFFLIFTLVPVLAGLIVISMSKKINSLMHGVR